jgi:hypothetical protein
MARDSIAMRLRVPHNNENVMLAASALHTTTMAPGTPSVAGYTHVLIVSDCWWSGPYQTQLAADPVVATRVSWEVVAMESLVGGECILAVLRACMLQSCPHMRWSTCNKQDASHSHVKPSRLGAKGTTTSYLAAGVP